MAHCPLGSFLISSCLMAQSAAAILVLTSTAPDAASELLEAGALGAGAAGVVAGAVCGAGSAVSLLFLQPTTRSVRKRMQENNLKCTLMSAPGKTGRILHQIAAEAQDTNMQSSCGVRLRCSTWVERSAGRDPAWVGGC